jgi:hypothetical protein
MCYSQSGLSFAGIDQFKRILISKGVSDYRHCPYRIRLGDFDGNGITDIFCGTTARGTGTGSNYFTLLKYDDGGVKQLKTWVWKKRSWCTTATIQSKISSTADFDADGRSDLLCHNIRYGIFSALNFEESQLRKVFREKLDFCKGITMDKLYLADINLDGAADLVCHSSSPTTPKVQIIIRLVVRSKIQKFFQADCTASCPFPSKILFGDFYGQRKINILCITERMQTKRMRILRLNGTNAFTVKEVKVIGKFCGSTSSTVYVGNFFKMNRTQILCHRKDGLFDIRTGDSKGVFQ